MHIPINQAMMMASFGFKERMAIVALITIFCGLLLLIPGKSSFASFILSVYLMTLISSSPSLFIFTILAHS
jgi:uncharacterized membrane protein YphA (DoxX/SURF4 family)